eukprot:TRINITY_DN39151_c0_g1_i1.p1 TRINITY_DN39151_c0_g1~~TRINITY_DN39151_c0_g1_i1.p1  ORF type:complete len:173 (+),score=42.95 TRINITY_DN39151_c0_g1_i1:40-519(+)
MSNKEASVMMTMYSTMMQDRRHELLGIIRKRANAVHEDGVPSAKRIALAPVKMDFLNCVKPTAGKKKDDGAQTPVTERAAAATPIPPTPESIRDDTTCSPSEIGIATCTKQTPDNGGKWWESNNLALQLEKQSEISPSAVFEPRLSPINACAIFEKRKK